MPPYEIGTLPERIPVLPDGAATEPVVVFDHEAGAEVSFGTGQEVVDCIAAVAKARKNLDTNVAFLREFGDVLAEEFTFADSTAALAREVRAERAWRNMQHAQQPAVTPEVPEPGVPDGTYATASQSEKNYLDALARWEYQKTQKPHSYVPKPFVTPAKS